MSKTKKKHINNNLLSRKKNRVNIETGNVNENKIDQKEIRETAKLLTFPTVIEISEKAIPNDEINQVQNTLKETELKKVLHTLVTISTALWRIKTKLDNETINGLPQQLRHLPRHIQAAWDALSSGAIEIKDPTGKPYVPGMAVNVIAFQPTEGVTFKFILETIKPSIFYRDRLIQRADVIVASEYKV
jgi:hypothetical protein